MALGATAGDVLWMVLRQSLQMIVSGVVAGAAGAFVALRMLERSTAGVQSMEPLTFILMIAILILAAFCASFVPARRASRLDPMKALRQE